MEFRRIAEDLNEPFLRRLPVDTRMHHGYNVTMDKEAKRVIDVPLRSLQRAIANPYLRGLVGPFVWGTVWAKVRDPATNHCTDVYTAIEDQLEKELGVKDEQKLRQPPPYMGQ